LFVGTGGYATGDNGGSDSVFFVVASFVVVKLLDEIVSVDGGIQIDAVSFFTAEDEEVFELSVSVIGGVVC
jgi:hypothetical protein